MVDYKHPVNPGLIGSRWHDPKRKHLHMGVDYKEGTGNFVRAIADGVVRVVNQHRLWGFHVQIEHADGRISSYHQLQRDHRPWVGDRLRQGDIVGRVGNPLIGWSQADKEKTGIWSGQVERDSSGTLVSTGPHLHLGILEGYGKPWINPETVITTKATATAPAGGGVTPINTLEEDDDNMAIRIKRESTGHTYTMVRGIYIKHHKNAEDAKIAGYLDTGRGDRPNERSLNDRDLQIALYDGGFADLGGNLSLLPKNGGIHRAVNR